MDIQWGTVFSYLGTAAIGFVGGVLKPTTEWYFEKKRKQRDYRQQIIIDCYKRIEEIEDRTEFIRTKEYSQIRPYLKEDAIKKIEDKPYVLHVHVHTDENGNPRGSAGPPNSCLKIIHNELSRLEKEWGLK
jgi:hypothetical protein